MKQGTKRYRAWCKGCDTHFVDGGKKCPKCGTRMPSKRLKSLEDSVLVECLDDIGVTVDRHVSDVKVSDPMKVGDVVIVDDKKYVLKEVIKMDPADIKVKDD